MRAVYAEKFGGDDWLSNARVGDIDDPKPRSGWAMVRVAAAALNHHDLWTLKGVSSRKLESLQGLGCDAAGTVIAYAGDPPANAPALGSRVVVHAVVGCGNCSRCLDGDELHCSRMAILSDPPLPGTAAELVCVPARNLIALPDSVDFDTAACLPTAYLTAYRLVVTRAGVRAGQTMLVQGAGGGVATAAIQIGVLAGARVLATSRTDERRAWARQLGAAEAFDPALRPHREIAAAAGGEGVDAVIETVGEATWDLSLRSVRSGGTIAVAGATTGSAPPAQLNRIFWKHITVAGSTMGTRGELETLVQMCADGRLAPAVDSGWSLSQARDALARLASGEQRGKVLVRP